MTYEKVSVRLTSYKKALRASAAETWPPGCPVRFPSSRGRGRTSARRCSNDFQFHCDDVSPLRITLALDCYDRESMSGANDG
jgi:hypothetical protein